MNYYIQGDAANADKIKAAFEELGINVLDFGFADKAVVYCSIGECVQYLPYSINLMNILYSHPDYKELELAVKPKFKVGDWITNGHCTVQVSSIGYEKINGTSYMMYYHNNNIIGVGVKSVDKEYHLWSIADAKDGDVLATDNGWTCIFKAFDGCVFSSYCFMDSQKWFCEFGSEAHTLDSRINGNIHPATKKQRDLLFRKMKEAGYQWDVDKKELRKIKPHYDISNFKPFDKVLARDTNYSTWKAGFYSHRAKDGWFVCVGSVYNQCIPFNDDTKHLLGTTDMCDERFINW